jgi:hypothetical protein
MVFPLVYRLGKFRTNPGCFPSTFDSALETIVKKSPSQPVLMTTPAFTVGSVYPFWVAFSAYRTVNWNIRE